MSKAEETLDALSAGVDTESEPHFVINSDRFIVVPESLKQIAIQHDHNIETVTFDCFRYWDGHDLSTMRVFVNYLRSDGGMGSSEATITEIGEDTMSFDWTISQHVTFVEGPLTILVCIKEVTAENEVLYHWNSELNSELFVGPGLNTGEYLEETYTDIITGLLVRMDEINLAVKITDVLVGGTSIVEDGVAKIPLASESPDKQGIFIPDVGLVHMGANRYGISHSKEEDIDPKTEPYKPIVPLHLDYAVKKALTDPKNTTYSEVEQEAAQDTLGVTAKLDGKLDKAGTDTTVRVYAVNPNGDQRTRHIATSAYLMAPNNIPQYQNDAEGWDNSYVFTGKLVTNDPVRKYHVANKKYVDDNFVLKVSRLNDTRNGLYMELTDGATIMVDVSQTPYGNAVSRFTNRGTAQTNTPTEDLDAANKKYVDDNTKLYEHRIEWVFRHLADTTTYSSVVFTIVDRTETMLIGEDVSGNDAFSALFNLLFNRYGDNNYLPFHGGNFATSGIDPADRSKIKQYAYHISQMSLSNDGYYITIHYDDENNANAHVLLSALSSDIVGRVSEDVIEI